MTTTKEIIQILKNLRLESGDKVMIHTSLKGLGEIENIKVNDKNNFCKSLYKCFDDVLQIEENIGTFVVPTFTHNYVRLQENFILESSKSEVGILSEYVRNMRGTIRTLHPINSVAIRGRYKNMFTNISTSGYGFNSFFDKFSQLENSKIVYFGADINHSTFVHHVEHMIGVSYVYNKAYFKPDVIVNNQKVDKPFFNSVRYLDKDIEPNYSILQKNLIQKNLINIEYINNFKVMVVKVKDLINETYLLLQENQCSLLENDYYVIK